MSSRREKSPRQRVRVPAVAPHVAAAQSEYLARIEQIRALYEETPVPVREIAVIVPCTERVVYKYASRFGWKPRAVAHPRRGGRFLPLTDMKPSASRGRANAAAAAAARSVRAGLLTKRAASAAVAETRRRAAMEAAVKRHRAQQDEAERQASARRKADRTQETQLRTLLIIAKMQRAGGAAMRAELKATLAKVYELFDTRLLEAERALSAAGPEASDAERHIVGALRKLREASPRPQKREGDANKPWTSPRDSLSEQEQRKELERSLTNLIAGSPPSSPASSPGRREAPSSGDPDSYGRAVPALSGSPGQARR